MWNVKLLATKVAVSLVAVGSLSFAGAGVAGAAPQVGTQPVSHSTAAGQQRACTRLHRHQVQATQNQARFGANTAKFASLAAKAQKAGNTKLANYWQSVVARRTTRAAKMKANFATRSSRLGHRVDKVHANC